jgi:tight adherence protein C
MSANRCEVLEIAAALLAAGGAVALTAGIASPLGEKLRGAAGRRHRGGLCSAAVTALATLNGRWLRGRPLDVLDGWICRAGRPSDLDPAELVAVVQLSALASFAVGVLLSVWLGTAPPLLLAACGAAAPLLRVRDRVRVRQRSIVRALPYAVDLLTLSVEAGLDFAAALAKVVEKGRQGPLAAELSIALKELRLGQTREQALRGLARRAGLPALTSFVQALVHADRMGTPLGNVLRVLATQMRVERTQRAEKLANEAPVKLLLPLLLCIFPTLFLMLFGPIAYQVFLGGSF